MYTTIGTYYSFEMTVCCPGQQTTRLDRDARSRTHKKVKVMYDIKRCTCCCHE